MNRPEDKAERGPRETPKAPRPDPPASDQAKADLELERPNDKAERGPRDG